MRKELNFRIKGMQRDLSKSLFNPEFAYENKNIRIIPTEENNTLLNVVNEKGNSKIILNENINGIPIGVISAGDQSVLYTTNGGFIQNISAQSSIITDIIASPLTITDLKSVDNIYLFSLDNNEYSLELLYSGNLDFNQLYPIEGFVNYENEGILKVYWTNGNSSPKVINIKSSSNTKLKWNDNSFDFTRKLQLKEVVSISKNNSGGGSFNPGIIQYAFSYFDKYGQQSNIFYISDLFYISYFNRGGEPNSIVSNSFNIEISNVDSNFDYLRIYSIYRSSLNSTPSVLKVADIAVVSDNTIYYTDNGSSGESINPTDLFYIGGEDIILETINQKDGTFFGGNITVKRNKVDSTIKSFFNGKIPTFSSDIIDGKPIDIPSANGLYPYLNQLNNSSSQIKYFKYLETYRFGVQFQDNKGKWSEVIYLSDVKNNEKVNTSYIRDDERTYLPIAYYSLNDADIIKKISYGNYIKIRPVVVYPNYSDRDCLCQGVLCPTVFNLGDRFGNAPFAQSSWFVRPNAPFDYNSSVLFKQLGGVWYPDCRDRENLSNVTSDNSRWCSWFNNESTITVVDSAGTGLASFKPALVNKGAYSEFRHNYPIPSGNLRNSEIQCTTAPMTDVIVADSYTDAETVDLISYRSDDYYIDQSILTLHSPDIEFDDYIKNIDLSNAKLRIIGLVPITSSSGDIDIISSTSTNTYKDSSGELPPGFYKENIGTLNESRHAWKNLISGAFWFDEFSGAKVANKNKYNTGFIVYPWHRNGSLNNQKFPSTDGTKKSMLSKKKLSNLKYSFNSYYLDSTDIWNAYVNLSASKTGISGAAIFDSNEVEMIKLPAPLYSGTKDISYYGNVNKLLIPPLIGGVKSNGYYIYNSGTQDASTIDTSHKLFINVSSGSYKTISDTNSDEIYGYDPISIKYKSTPHAVIALNYSTDHYQRVLPTHIDFDGTSNHNANYVAKSFSTNRLFWEPKNSKVAVGISQDILDLNMGGLNGSVQGTGPEYGYLWIGELYRDDVVNRFGGNSEEALETNRWVPCGDPVSLFNNDGIIKTSLKIVWSEGDTYYQRYDHLKTYPFTTEDQNQIVDIVSFMCETRVNLDGRYDRNRGQASNLHVSPINFNLLNKAYTQQNNLFTYNTINENKLNINSFKNTIIWSKSKTSGELIDSWTNLNLTSTLDLDGNKGELRSIKKFNNELIAFQDRGISNILFNSRSQLTSSDGVPIEIANSGKVDGKRYLLENIGCTNKWSICETQNGLYFIDSITKGIYFYNGKFDNFSDRLGFRSWINSNLHTIDIWSPTTFNGFVTSYDKTNGDVYFTSKTECLAFSEPLGQFSSFYSYESTPYMFNIGNKFIQLKQSNLIQNYYHLYLHGGGDYNFYFDKYEPFYVSFIASGEGQTDKIFDNLEFRSDTFNNITYLPDETFDTLTVWNEYQTGTTSLVNTPGRPSSLKKKFRTWRANIPRDISNNRDRIRNPWVNIKLSKETENTYKTILHDLKVYYLN